MNEVKTEKKKSSKLLVALLILVLLASLIPLSPVLAKYITQRKKPENLVLTNYFYFRSNYLSADFTVDEQTNEITGPVIPVSVGTSDVVIELYNFADALRMSDIDVNYELTLSKPTGSTASLSSTQGMLEKNALSTDTIYLSGLEPGQRYEVRGVAEYGPTGYRVELAAAFVVAGANPVAHYAVIDGHGYTGANSDFAELFVWTEGSAQGAVSITIPSGWVLDPTENETSLGLYSSHTYRLFKTSNSASALSDAVFSNKISVGGTIATSETP